ncbi:phage tail tape measure protein [Sinomonas cyclohexanicum]|uniref:phage tail tape measure protein n=1 Tax=Sinomonas cyclohexanicum TaxID=322009 RepID=UPI001E589283|nr:phage tail tape measure protein [Corynebacterium cyclohexanicum]
MRANASQAIAEMGRVQAAMTATAASAEAQSAREAAAARAAAAQAATLAQEKKAAYESAAAAQVAAAKEGEDAQIAATERTKLAQAEYAAAAQASAQADARAVEAMAAAHETSSARVSRAWSTVKNTANMVATFTLAGAAIIGAASIKMAADFQRETELLVTAGGESQSALESVRSGILNIATSTGTATSQLAAGMYVMEKAGYRGADGLKVLQAAAEGAKAENVDLATMTQAVTDVMLDYGKGADQAVSVTNGLVAASGAAKTTMQDFAASMSQIIPTAANAGLSFAQVGGALATMTQHGESAQQSAQNLSNLLFQLEKPSNVASHALQQMGIDVTALSANLGDENGGIGLLASLQRIDAQIKAHMGPDGQVVQDAMKNSASATADLQTIIAKMPPKLAELSRGFLDGSVSQTEYQKGFKSMGGSADALGNQFLSLSKSTLGVNDIIKSGNPAMQTYVAAWNKAAGGMTGARTALMLLMNNSKQFEDNIKTITAAEDQNGQHISTWAQTQSLFTTQLDMTVQSAEKLGIELGAKLLPAAQGALSGIADLFHGFEEGNPVLWGTVYALGAVTAAVVGAKIVGGLVSISKSMIALGASAATGMSQFINGFRNADAAASSFTGKMGTLGGAVRGVLPALSKLAIAAAAAGLAIQGLEAIDRTFGSHGLAPSLEQTTNAMLQFGSATDGVDSLFQKWDTGLLTTAPAKVHDLGTAFAYLSDGGNQVVHSIVGVTNGFAGLFGGHITDGVEQIQNRISGLGQSLGQMVQGGSMQAAAQGFDQIALAGAKSGKSTQDVLNMMPAYRDALLSQAQAANVALSPEELLEFAMGRIPQKMQEAAKSTGDFVDEAGRIRPITPDLKKSLDDAGVSADGLVTDLGKVVDGMSAAGMATVSTRDATSRFYQAVNDAKTATADLAKQGVDLSGALNQQKTDFDLTTAAGQALNAKFEDVKNSGLTMAKSFAGDGVNAQQEVQGALQQTYNNLVTTANGMGITGGAADDLARRILGIPTGVTTQAWLDDYASSKAAEITNAINAIPTSHLTTVTIAYTETGNPGTAGAGVVHANAAGGYQAFAGGGAVGVYPYGGMLTGPGTGISDSMLIRASNGEFVTREAMVQKYGIETFTALNNGSAPVAAVHAAISGRPVGGGGQTVNVYATTNASPDDIARAVGWTLRTLN